MHRSSSPEATIQLPTVNNPFEMFVNNWHGMFVPVYLLHIIRTDDDMAM